MSYENNPPKLVAFIDKAMSVVKAHDPRWFALCEKINWRVNDNLRRVLGQACYRMWTIEMSGPYLASGSDEDVYNTVTHELAHFIAMYIYNEKGHGRVWKVVHHNLGGNSKRCTNPEGYHVVRNVVKRVIVGRDGKEYRITVKRWENQQYGLERLGYRYLRTVRVNSDGSVSLLHSHKEVK